MEENSILLTNKIKKKKDNEPWLPIKNILISDSKTGFVILEYIYKWSDQAVTTNLGSLILSFYQFAREVDDGEIVSVNFERFGKTRGRTGTLNKSNQMDTMKMICQKNELFVVSVFYDMRGQSVINQTDSDNLSRLLQMIEIEFQMKCGGLYLEQQPLISTLDSSQDKAETISREIRENFAFFRPTIDSITQSCFSNNL